MGNKKFGKQQILLLIRAAFFIFSPAIFVTAFTGARMLVEEIAAKETLKLDEMCIRDSRSICQRREKTKQRTGRCDKPFLFWTVYCI